MTASERAERLWAGAVKAAGLMAEAGAERGYVLIGAGLPIALVAELAELAGVPVHTQTHESSVAGWGVIYAFEVDPLRCGVGIHVQGSRPATPEEIAAARGESAQAGGAA